MDKALKSALSQQFGATIEMLENVPHACPDHLWRVRLWDDEILPESSEFWYITLHTLFWLDLYLSGSVDGFLPPEPFTLDELNPEGILPEEPYTKDELLAYLDYSRQKRRSRIETLTDEAARGRCRFSWGEITFVGLLFNNMRHVQEHVAQLNMILGQRVNWSPRWVAKEGNNPPN